MRTLILGLVAFGFAYLTALGVRLEVPHTAELWEWTVGLWVIFLFIFIAPFRLWLSEIQKVEAFEEAARPKLEISPPIESIEPKGQKGKAFRTWRLKITNASTVVVKNCYAKKKSFINNRGQQSDIIGMRFKWGGDYPKFLQANPYEYKQSFDISPRGHEYVDIACMSETEDNASVVMLYAIPGAGASEVRNCISPVVFPHRLIVEVCADNLIVPLEITYDLSVTQEELLRMDKAEAIRESILQQ